MEDKRVARLGSLLGYPCPPSPLWAFNVLTLGRAEEEGTGGGWLVGATGLGEAQQRPQEAEGGR